MEAARATGAEAIHPGYGFLSENADFAEACAAAGVVFIGPTPAQMRDFGLKHRARALAERNGVPLLPGSGLLATSRGRASARPRASAIRSCSRAPRAAAASACSSCRGRGRSWPSLRTRSSGSPHKQFRSAAACSSKNTSSARGTSRCRFSATARAAWSRSASATARSSGATRRSSRRRPRRGLIGAIRAALVRDGRPARARPSAIARAGTVEFVFDTASGEFYFLEVNTRLQVEHGVTEEVTGVDLVEWMIRQAARRAIRARDAAPARRIDPGAPLCRGSGSASSGPRAGC